MDLMLQSIVSNPTIQGTSCARSLSGNRNNIFRMMDASGKFPSGFASGNLADLGSFDQCLGGPIHDSHYCTMLLTPKNQSLIRNIATYTHQVDFNVAQLLIGVCAPTECQPEQLRAVYQTAFDDWFNASVDSCQSAWTPLHPTQRTSLLLIGCWLILAFLFTLLLGFRISAPKAIKTCLTLATLKTIATLWVLLGHTYAIVEPHIVGLSLRFYEMRKGLMFCLISNAHVSVEIFFCVTGILIARKKVRRRLVTVILGIIARYIRLTLPALALLLLAPLFPITCNGPASLLIMKQRFLDCPHNWWAIPIHLNNFRPMREKCLPHLWYISADLQLFVIVWPLHVLIVRKRHRMVLISVVALIATAYIALETFLYNYAPCVMAGRNMHEIFRMSNEVYQRPIAHLPSVIIGYLCGCLCGSKMLDSQWLSKIRSELLILAVVSMSYSTFGGHPWISGAWDYTLRPFYPAFYAAIHRPLFALGISLIYLIQEHPCEVAYARTHGKIISNNVLFCTSVYLSTVYVCY
ncbi:nose resistant to fluoxetine protein 6-like isoform X1 [Varroa destructor]|uniref:Nose resistant-to-fluoxetine protein N-terminal domain-containing protein n=1 Tax=Varroa destructor TaxID=109461 RepID=A0A7M7J1B0_VARDE|nr:nose resistant to fluoxetine protein 6-like isoform X1 [Varroa destructor]